MRIMASCKSNLFKTDLFTNAGSIFLREQEQQIIVQDNHGILRIPVYRRYGLAGQLTFQWRPVEFNFAEEKLDFYCYEQLATNVMHEFETMSEVEIRIIHEPGERFYSEQFALKISTGTDELFPKIFIISNDSYHLHLNKVRRKVEERLEHCAYYHSSVGVELDHALSANGGETKTASGLDCVLHVFAYFFKVITAIPAHGYSSLLAAWTILLLVPLGVFVSDLINFYQCLYFERLDFVIPLFISQVGFVLPDMLATVRYARMRLVADKTIHNSVVKIIAASSTTVLMWAFRMSQKDIVLLKNHHQVIVAYSITVFAMAVMAVILRVSKHMVNMGIIFLGFLSFVFFFGAVVLEFEHPLHKAN